MSAPRMAAERMAVPPPAEDLGAPAAPEGAGTELLPPVPEALLAPALPPAVRRRLLRRHLDLLGLLVLVAFVASAYVASLGGAYRRETLERAAAGDPGRVARLERRLASHAPRGTYLVVDTYGNRLRVFRGDKMLREAVCSTGSGTVLKDPKSGREWVFDTPQGERRVQRKVKDPVWVKPDWAFIEEGYEPPKNSRDRVDDFSLGDYGLYLGDGYIIHGTLFQTLLGKGVTHGCIRLGDADLEWVYWRVGLGTPVYLY